MEYPAHAEKSAALAIDPAKLFNALDDHRRLTEHMAKTSLTMGGGKMRLETDEHGGRVVGSIMRATGTAFGVGISVTEMVVERDPPRRKVWRTTETPDLIVIGDYRMGFDIKPADRGVSLTIWIDFAPSSRHRLLSRLLGKAYARWCVDHMLESAVSVAREDAL